MRGSTNTSSMRDSPRTSVNRSAICAVPPESKPSTAEPVSIAAVGSHWPLSATTPTGSVTGPSGVSFNDLHQQRREQAAVAREEPERRVARVDAKERRLRGGKRAQRQRVGAHRAGDAVGLAAGHETGLAVHRPARQRAFEVAARDELVFGRFAPACERLGQRCFVARAGADQRRSRGSGTEGPEHEARACAQADRDDAPATKAIAGGPAERPVKLLERGHKSLHARAVTGGRAVSALCARPLTLRPRLATGLPFSVSIWNLWTASPQIASG